MRNYMRRAHKRGRGWIACRFIRDATYRDKMRSWITVLALALGLFSGFAVGEIFVDTWVNATRVEDTPSLPVGLQRPLECQRTASAYMLFSIVNEPIPFELVPDPNLPVFVDVHFTRPPDAELGDEYYEVLVECDDRNSRRGPPVTATVAVTIISVNEYSPYAPQDSYTITFPETTGAGEVVGSAGPGPNQYSIIDEDGGLDGRLHYTALDDPPNPYFTLEAETGVLTLQREVDYDVEGSFTSSMLIHGCDRATLSALCPNVTVTLILEPVNDNDPVFLQSVVSVTVEEGLHRGSVLGTVTCSDADLGEGSYDSMKVISSTLELLQLSDTQNGTANLLLTAVLDYDSTNQTQFEAELRCYDSVSEGEVRSDNATVLIHMLPVNDNAPLFSAEWYNTTVLESLPVGSSLVRSQCSDHDRGYGELAGMQLYQPSSAVNRTFFLDPDTGQLTLTGTLDYDNPQTRNHIFTLRCWDEGGREGFANISISTLPVSDEPLVFQTPTFHISVDRLADVHSKIGQVIAIDGDKGEHPIIVYAIENNDLFDIDDEGYIILKDYLSRDKGDFFNLTVEARDSQGTIQGQVEVEVTGLLSFLGVINVVIGAFGLLVVIVIGVLVALCSYFCWKLYRIPREGPVTDVPVFMRGDMLPRPHSGQHRRSRATSFLREKSTLSLQRDKRKPKQSFKKRSRQRPGLRDSFYGSSADPGAADPSNDQILFGANPYDMEMTIFSNQTARQYDMKEEDKVGEEEDRAGEEEDEAGEEESEEAYENIFNPEDAGLVLEDIMLFPGEDQIRWTQYEEEDGGEERKIDLGEEESDFGAGSGESDFEAESGESDFYGSAEWDPPQDDDSLTLTHI